jgi:hypothetical protein
MRTESCTGINDHPGGMLYLPDETGACHYVPAVWTVTVSEVKTASYRPDWTVQGTDQVGCVVPAEGPRTHKSLAKARKDAAALFATLTGAPRQEPWPHSEKT